MEFIDIAKAFLQAMTQELDKSTSTKGVIIEDEKGNSVSLFTPSHIQFAVYGRGPGKRPPLQNMLDFVKGQGIIFDKTDARGTAFAIQASIAKNGTKNFVPNAPDALQQVVDKNIEKYYQQLSQYQLSIMSEQILTVFGEQFPKTTQYKI
tara:strand:- start:11214 stop:11663 length:450 start_codon:yes stop_codon:yes gene_type:complete